MFWSVFAAVFWLVLIGVLLYLVYGMTSPRVSNSQFQIVMWAGSTVALLGATISVARAYLLVLSLVFAAIGLARRAQSPRVAGALTGAVALWFLVTVFIAANAIVVVISVIQFILVSALFLARARFDRSRPLGRFAGKVQAR
jgi:hypothetical protein